MTTWDRAIYLTRIKAIRAKKRENKRRLAILRSRRLQARRSERRLRWRKEHGPAVMMRCARNWQAQGNQDRSARIASQFLTNGREHGQRSLDGGQQGKSQPASRKFNQSCFRWLAFIFVYSYMSILTRRSQCHSTVSSSHLQALWCCCRRAHCLGLATVCMVHCFHWGQRAAISLHRLLPGGGYIQEARCKARFCILGVVEHACAHSGGRISGILSGFCRDTDNPSTTVTEWKAVYGRVEARIRYPHARVSAALSLICPLPKAIWSRQVRRSRRCRTTRSLFRSRNWMPNSGPFRRSWKQAQSELGRGQTLVGKGIVTAQRLDQLRTEVDVARNQLAATEAQRSVIVQQGAEGDVLAPGDGRVLTVPITRGAVIMTGEVVAIIGGGGVFLRLAVPERHIAMLETGHDHPHQCQRQGVDRPSRQDLSADRERPRHRRRGGR